MLLSPIYLGIGIFLYLAFIVCIQSDERKAWIDDFLQSPILMTIEIVGHIITWPILVFLIISGICFLYLKIRREEKEERLLLELYEQRERQREQDKISFKLHKDHVASLLSKMANEV
jgi:hypothetical protein